MALYKDGNELTHTESEDFDKVHSPGDSAPFSGIYLCINCRDEYAYNAGDPLPPQNHRQHSANKGAIRWRLLVKTQRGPN
ncbi:hypothetical protein FQ775_12375 [Nitratireductor mangrovi]|uniref:Protein L n=1 Tax=Nitratireductor mangrovi TaxID=2599600 RepID=A0A5B8L0L0_9HYPH|nr:hypothetical protein [Nitratireductor mangrovi]QDZ01108.1 hypothetical protein FQ775_12375 [Nitratireductor mangrovi]